MSDEREADAGGAGDLPPSSEDREEARPVRGLPGGDRELLTPRESSDRAGADLADEYENEEDGGS